MDETQGRHRSTARLATAWLVAAALLLGPAGTAAGSHLPSLTARCTYEIGEVDANTGLSLDFATQDPTGLTEDGVINSALCAFQTPDTDPGENSALGPAHVLLNGVNVIEGQYSTAQASIVDDVFGNAVGGILAADFNHDHIVGDEEQGEPLHRFCGTSPVVTVGQDSDGDGHPDFGWGLVAIVHGYREQVLHCDPVDAPTSTTGGVLDPAGGIYVTVSG